MMTQCNNCFKEYDEQLGLCPFCGYASGEQAAEVFCLSPGTEIAERYIIGEMLGLGGFGITYKAWDKKLNTILAIKEYFPSGLVNRLPGKTDVILVASKREREFIYGRTRFLEEARNMAKFSTHKNIVNVFDFFESNNTAYIVMEFLDGKTLSQVLQQQNVPLPYDYCINIASDICAALRAIHKENILHRDISPDNIMICNDGTVKLFDFGAARFSAGMENKVTVVVKPGFAPPEQYDKVNRQDPRTDIYALGATLYYAMTGVKPEESTNRKIEDTLVEPSAIDSSIPQNVSTAIMRAMSVQQQYRYPNVDEFEKTLLNEKKAISVQQVHTKRKRRRAAGILMSVFIVIGVASVFLYLLNAQKKMASLPDADLTVWYIKTGNGEADQAKAYALDYIIDAFTDEYSNITVELKPVDQEAYAAALEEACANDDAPDIFESTGLPDAALDSAISLSEEIRALESDSYYADQLSAEKRYPTSIVVPVIYVNKTLGTVEAVKEIGQLIDVCKDLGEYFVVKESAIDLYAALYGTEIADYSSETARDDFLARDAFIYFGDSSDYFDVQVSLPGEYTLLMPDCDKATYRYGNSWSVTKLDEDTTTSAVALITYFNSNLSQNYFHIDSHAQGGNLPFTKTSMAEFLSVYDELDAVGGYLARTFVAPLVDADLLIGSADTSKLDELKGTPFPAFEDVADDSWYAEAITDVCARGLMYGVNDTTFAPERRMTKAGAVVVLYRVAGSPTTSGATVFEDVDSSTESGKAVVWAYENGIIPKASDDLFHGESIISLETTMLLFYRYAKQTGYAVTTSAEPEQFADGDMIETWATDGVMWAITNNLISVQNGGNIAPKTEMTRGRFAIILQRFLNLYNLA